MDIPDIMKGLKLDAWYKVSIYFGAIAFIISLFVDVKGVTNSQLQMISSGLFFVGIGEWKNRKHVYAQKPPNIYTGPAVLLKIQVRQPDFLGIILDLLGVILLIAGIGSLVYFSFATAPVSAPTVFPTPTTTP